MKATIDNKEYKIIKETAILGAARLEPRSNRADPDHWISMYIIDEHDVDNLGNPRKYAAWYYVSEMGNEGLELDQINYEKPHDLQDIGY